MNAMTTHDDARAAAAPKRTERTCAGCGKHADAQELVRVVHDPGSGEIAIDLAASGFGRGGHVHPSPDCVAKAIKGGFARVFKAAVVADPKKVGDEIVLAADRRIEGLLTGARRAGQLVVGSDSVVEALRAERVDLLVVARDAAAATKLGEVERAVAEGRAIAFSKKTRLGLLMGRDEVALIAIANPGVATAVLRTYRVSGPFRGALDGVATVSAEAHLESSEDAWSSSEVR
jgi:predicted RNA-binding protein YlxR (DUF448 family)